MIRAECHTVDNMRIVQFDATPWFEQARSGKHRHACRPAVDSTMGLRDALERRSDYGQLHDLLEYARERLQSESVEDPTWPIFECRVNDRDALTFPAPARDSRENSDETVASLR
jgi:hypothetical protein